MARRVAVLALLAGVACGNGDHDHPPAYQAPPRGNLVGCAALRQAEPTLRDDALYVGDEPAACAVDGLECSLVGVVATESSCDPPEVPLAYCTLGEWRQTCMEPAIRSGYGGQAGWAGDAEIQQSGHGGSL